MKVKRGVVCTKFLKVREERQKTRHTSQTSGICHNEAPLFIMTCKPTLECGGWSLSSSQCGGSKPEMKKHVSHSHEDIEAVLLFRKGSSAKIDRIKKLMCPPSLKHYQQENVFLEWMSMKMLEKSNATARKICGDQFPWRNQEKQCPPPAEKIRNLQ